MQAMTDNHEENLIEQIGRLLRYHASLGIKEYPRTANLENFLKKQASPPPAADASTKSRPKRQPVPSLPEKKHAFDPELTCRATLRDVQQEIGDCHRCSLHKSRTSIVYGQGNEKARLMVVADAPSPDDDRLALPLQGEQGVLLDRMLQAIDLSRDEIYITTLVKCFPGPGAKPAEKEIRTCLPFLFRQIEIICPLVLCTMGTLASQILLQSRRSLFQLRGRFYNFNDLCSAELAERIFLMPSLPPALLIDNPELKKASWQDLQMIQKKLSGN